MLIKRLMLITLLIGMNSAYSLDVNALASTYGVQNESINRETVVAIVKRIADSDANYNLDPDIAALSAILRAQLTAKGNTTQNGLGTSGNFATLYPFYTEDVANQLKIIVGDNSTPSQRREAARLVTISQWMGWVNQNNLAPNSGVIKYDINNAKNSSGQGVLDHARVHNNAIVEDLLNLGAEG